MRPHHSLRLPLAGVTAALALVVTFVAPGTSNAVAVTNGYRDFQYQVGASTFRATADKPQSKVWYAGGSWWGGLFHLPAGSGSGDFEIYKFDGATQAWTGTGVLVDERDKSHADYLFDDATNKLWVVSTNDGSGTDGVRAYRYSFSGSTYTLDSGFTFDDGGTARRGVVVATDAAESTTIAEDSTGRLWVTYTVVNASDPTKSDVMIATSTDGLTWSSQVLPSQATSPAADDISATIAFGTSIGVMWSDQVADGSGDTGFYFSVHADGAPIGTWSARETVDRGPLVGNDHINLKTYGGKVYAGLKTETDQSEEFVTELAVRTAAGTWSTTGVTLRDKVGVDNNQTRPQIAIDETNNEIYFFAAESEDGGSIYYKKASLDALTFPAGKGTALIASATDLNINDPSTSKQNVTTATGLLVIASDKASGYYLHSFPTLIATPPPTPSPTATATPAPTVTPAPTATPHPTSTPTPTPKPTVVRYAGSNRYGTAAAVSAARYKTVPVPVVYVATGTGFADALSAGPAAAKQGGPVLLVTRTGIPSETAAELSRLHPGKIIIAGGSGVISDTVKSLLTHYSSVVIRRSGGDRYATSAIISSSTFTSPVPVAYIATGANFPDALAGVPAAGRQHGPILLTTKDDVPTVIMNELKRLKPVRIVVLGGTGVISGTVVNELKTVTSNVTRYAGPDRTATAVAVSKAVFPTGAAVVYVANGLNFPDALAGGPPASVQGAPLLLVLSSSVPSATSAEITRLGAKTVVILGGTGVVSTNVANQLKTLIGG